MADVSFFSIPGNIKQALLPFQIKPDGYINQIYSTSNAVKSTIALNVGSQTTKYPQVFTFKSFFTKDGNAIGLKSNEKLTNNVNGLGKISFIPKTYEEYFDYDISHKLLYTRDGQDLTYADMLDNIPSIQIREFLPDTKLDQLLDVIAGLMDILKKLISGLFEKKEGEEEQKNQNQNIIIKLKNILVYLTGTEKPSLIEDIISLYSDSNGNEKSDVTDSASSDFKIKNNRSNDYVIKLVYLLYCKLQSFATTNIYELPGEIDGNSMYKSPDGMAGWKSDKSGIMSLSEIGGGKGFGGFLSKLVPNVSINYMPFWDPKGVAKAEPAIKLKLSLVNDTLYGSIHNFIFVNTLVPNNRYLQYNIFQHSPCLYDVKIDGYDRLFACAATIDVKYQGTLRNPSAKFYSELKKHVNTNLVDDAGKFLKSLEKNKNIKIPDTYEVEISFQSILPLSYNRLLLNYLINFDQLDQTKMYQNSLFRTAIEKISNSFTGVWKGDLEITKDAENSSIVGSLGNAITNLFG